MKRQDAMLTLALDYAPILSPSAITMYLCYYALRDENGVVDVTFANLKEHLGKLTASTIIKYNEELRSVGLIEAFSEEENGPVAWAPHRKKQIRVFLPTPFTSRQRTKLFGNQTIDSEIRDKSLTVDRLPLEYQRLLSKKDLQAAFKKLKRERFTISHLIEHFGLDKGKVQLWLSNKSFKAQIVRAMKSVVNELSKLEVQQELKMVAKKKKKGSTIKTADEMYEMLMKAEFDKEGNPVPVDKWQSSHLLRYFCVLYEKYNGGRKYTIMFPNGKSFSSKELRDMTMMLRAFNNKAQEAVKYMEWVFETKEKTLEAGIFGTGILRTPGMINEYKKKASKPLLLRDTDPIDEQFISWIKENVVDIYEQYDLDTMKDLFWLKEVYDGEDRTEEVVLVIEEGIKRGIVPKNGNFTFK